MLAIPQASRAQATDPAAATPAPAAQAAPAPAGSTADLNALPENGKKTIKESRKQRKADKAIRSKDTVRADRRAKKAQKIDPLAGKDANLPDKALYDKAQAAMKSGHFDVARLDLQTLLNTYGDSQYQMRAKLAIADSWYREGGTAALTQAEQEYADFRVFFPNSPEAAEAQMRIGDIYFRQMDKPDRDYAKAVHAEEEYRRMLTDYPQSTLVPEAKQRLREVQEVLATREAEIGAFYATHTNWPATIARYKTVIDTYPEYSRLDEVLIGLGDAYAAEAQVVRLQQLPEAPKARLEQQFDGDAAAAYRKVVLEHSASPHVEDAKDRLAAMNLPIPAPNAEQVAASEALENSRSQYSLKSRAELLFFHKPDVVAAARVGDPSLVDPKATIAPQVAKGIIAEYNSALHPEEAAAAAPSPAPTGAAATETAGSAAAAPAVPATPSAPLSLQDVPTAGATDTTAGGSSVTEATPATPAGAPATGVGVEVLTPGVNTAPTPAEGNAAVNGSTGGLAPVGPPNATPLPAIEKAPEAPDAINEAAGTNQPKGGAAPPAGKKAKSDYDKSDESSSKHKKKKGVGKLNPF